LINKKYISTIDIVENHTLKSYIDFQRSNMYKRIDEINSLIRVTVNKNIDEIQALVKQLEELDSVIELQNIRS